MPKNYTEGEALENIMRSKGVTDLGLYIEVVRGALGIKRLGILDFLRSKCKRRVIMVDKASKRGKKMKEHKWNINEVRLSQDIETQGYILSFILVSTDRRRTDKYLSILVRPKLMTMRDVADALRWGNNQIEIYNKKRLKKNKGPKVDPRQIEMFGGNNEKPAETNLGETV